MGLGAYVCAHIMIRKAGDNRAQLIVDHRHQNAVRTTGPGAYSWPHSLVRHLGPVLVPDQALKNGMKSRLTGPLRERNIHTGG